MFELTTGKLILITVIIILLFGAKKIPELAKGLGESIRHMKKAFKEGEGEDKK